MRQFFETGTIRNRNNRQTTKQETITKAVMFIYINLMYISMT